MKRSRRELSLEMVICWNTFRYNQITLSPCFTFIPKTGVVQFKIELKDLFQMKRIASK